VRDILDGRAPVISYFTVIEAQLLAGLAHRELGDRRAANQAAERALALAEAERPVLPFLMTGSRELLEALPRHETAHVALLTEILDVMHGAAAAAGDQHLSPSAEGLSSGELRVLRYLPTNLSRPEIATELSVSPNTVGTQIRSIYAKLQVRDRSSAVQRARDLRLLSPDRTRLAGLTGGGRDFPSAKGLLAGAAVCRPPQRRAALPGIASHQLQRSHREMKAPSADAGINVNSRLPGGSRHRGFE
jgi:DNA-binding CsgD family transcriptional regulator